MMSNFAFEMAELLLSLVKAHANGKAQEGVTIAGILVQIIQKTMKAYRDHTGKPLDPSLIKAEDLV
jgi:hypothetical protein